MNCVNLSSDFGPSYIARSKSSLFALSIAILVENQLHFISYYFYHPPITLPQIADLTICHRTNLFETLSRGIMLIFTKKGRQYPTIRIRLSYLGYDQAFYI